MVKLHPRLFLRPKSRSQRIKILIENGHFQVMGMNRWYSHWRDPYHLMLTISWLGFISIVALLYLGTNVFFAALYWLGGDCLAGATPGSFLDYFFFSVQTLASIGYGAMYPKNIYAHTIVTIEAMIALVGIAVLTGLAFARFSHPSARVLFSQVAVIAPHEGIPTLSFRAANQRRNQILEAQLQVYLLRDEVTAEGHDFRRIYDLRLIRNHTPGFALTWLAMHPIDESSPLYGMDQAALTETNAIINVTLKGIDETVTQTVHTHYTYAPQDILWNHRFVDIVHWASDKYRYIDYQHFHDAIQISPIGPSRDCESD